MTILEDAIREVFASQVVDPPVVDDPASVAIRRARAVQRRRTAMTGAAAAVLLVVALGTALSLRGWWERPDAGVVGPGLLPPDRASTAPTPWDGREIGVALHAGGTVWTPTGQRLWLRGVEPVRRAYRTPLGWVYGAPDRALLLPDDGTPVDLVTGVDQWLIRADGAELAAVAGGELRVAPISAGGLGEPVVAPVPAGTTLVAFPDERLIFAGRGGAWYDYWHPGTPYEPTHMDEIVVLYDGMVGDDMIGLVQDGDGYCLAVITAGPDGLHPSDRKGCDLGFWPPTEAAPEADTAGWLSPDGTWLALPHARVLWLVQLTDLTDGTVNKIYCPREAGVIPFWLDTTTLLTSSDRRAVRCHVDGTIDATRLPQGLGADWQYARILGPAA